MALEHKPLEDLTEADLQELVDNKVSEWKTLEFKKELPKGGDGEKKEFLADVTSLANAAGGHLVYGIEAIKEGIATQICGLPGVNADAETLRLESILRDGARPRIIGVHTRGISLANGNSVLVMQVPRSWNSPHMVAFNDDSRFWVRDSNGKHRMDVTELRHAFLLGETVAEKIRNFRLERLSRIVGGETPVILEDGPKIVLHVIPVDAFKPGGEFALESLETIQPFIPPLGSRGQNHLYDLDGFVSFSFPYDQTQPAYTLFFRNRIIEAVSGRLCSETENDKFIASVAYEDEMIAALPKYAGEMLRFGAALPFVVTLSLIDVRGVKMYVSPDHGQVYGCHPILQDQLVLPDLLMETPKFDVARFLRPAFDMVWNACGYPRSYNYDNDGNWTGGR